MELRQTFTVRVPPDVAFSFFEDPQHGFDRFAVDCRVTWTGPIGPGATFHIAAPSPTDDADGIVDEYQPPERLSYRLWVSDHPERGGVVTIEFRPTPEGTEVAASTATDMSLPLELAARVLRPWLAHQARRGTKRIVQTLESDYRTDLSASGDVTEPTEEPR